MLRFEEYVEAQPAKRAPVIIIIIVIIIIVINIIIIVNILLVIIIVIIIIIETSSAHKWNLVDISSVDEPTSLPSSRGKLDSEHLDKMAMVMVMTNHH